jgi:hypothetical protein
MIRQLQFETRVDPHFLKDSAGFRMPIRATATARSKEEQHQQQHPKKNDTNNDIQRRATPVRHQLSASGLFLM